MKYKVLMSRFVACVAAVLVCLTASAFGKFVPDSLVKCVSPPDKWMYLCEGQSLRCAGFVLSDSAPADVEIDYVIYCLSDTRSGEKDWKFKVNEAPYALDYEIKGQRIAHYYTLQAVVHVKGGVDYYDTDVILWELSSICITDFPYSKQSEPKVLWGLDVKFCDNGSSGLSVVVVSQDKSISGRAVIKHLPWYCTPKLTMYIDGVEVGSSSYGNEPVFNIDMRAFAKGTHELQYMVLFKYPASPPGLEVGRKYKLIVE